MKNVRGIVLSEDEVIIREYEASNLEMMNAQGYVIATNRRLIFTGSTKTAFGNSILVRDTKIDSITGVMGGLSKQKSFKQIIFGVIMALIGLMLIFNDSPLIGLILSGLGGFIAYKGLSAGGVHMYVSIMSSQSTPVINVSVEAGSGFFSRIKGHDAFLTVSASGPGAHTEQLIQEIGALIQDIQTMGDLAVGKWENKPLKSSSFQTNTSMNQFSNTFQSVKEKATATSNSIDLIKTQAIQKKQQNIQPTTQLETVQNIYKKCGDCGMELEKDTLFCGDCGKKVGENVFG